VAAAVQDRDRLERGRNLDVTAAVRGAVVDLVREVVVVGLQDGDSHQFQMSERGGEIGKVERTWSSEM